jgi:hypothetical protein
MKILFLLLFLVGCQSHRPVPDATAKLEIYKTSDGFIIITESGDQSLETKFKVYETFDD